MAAHPLGGTAPLSSNTPSNHAGTCKVSPLPFWTRSYLRQDLALPQCCWETSARNPTGVFTVCTQVATPSELLGYACSASGSPYLKTPSKGVSFVASRSRVPRRTTCPPLWLRRLLAQDPLYHTAGRWRNHAFVTSPAGYIGWLASTIPSSSLFCCIHNCRRGLSSCGSAKSMLPQRHAA